MQTEVFAETSTIGIMAVRFPILDNNSIYSTHKPCSGRKPIQKFTDIGFVRHRYIVSNGNILKPAHNVTKHFWCDRKAQIHRVNTNLSKRGSVHTRGKRTGNPRPTDETRQLCFP